jgi:endonuclease YncB( thermonuclease family)
MACAACGGFSVAFLVASILLSSSIAPARAPAETHVSAPADRLSVIDGDTLLLDEQVVRLAGVAAPARGAICRVPGQADMDCGAAATNALAVLVRGASVECAIHGHDTLGRPSGECTAGGRSLNQAMLNGFRANPPVR